MFVDIEGNVRPNAVPAQRKRVTFHQAVDRMANTIKWLTTATSDKKKKDDDYGLDVEGGSSFLVNKTHKGKGKKMGMPYVELAVLVLVCLLTTGGLYVMLSGLTGALVRPAGVVGMYEPNDDHLYMVRHLLALEREHEYETLQTTLVNVAEAHCKEQFPFDMTEDASITFHSHLLQLVHFMSEGGKLDQLVDGHVVVGEDGSIYNIEGDHPEAGTNYATCDLVNAMVWYNHHLQEDVDATKTDVDERWEESYGGWEEAHKTLLSGDVNKDARALMLALANDKPVDFELEFHHALGTHCQHIAKGLSGDHAMLQLVAQAMAVFRTVDEQTVQHEKQVTVSPEGHVRLHDSREFLRGTVMTCPLLDKMYHQHGTSLEDQVKSLISEFRSGDLFGTELAVDGLIDAHCQPVLVNLGDNAVHNFKGHISDLLRSVTTHEALGKNDFVVNSKGELWHKPDALKSGAKPRDLYTCKLLDAISGRGDHTRKHEHKDQFTNNYSGYEDERQEMAKGSKDAKRDVAVVRKHLDKGEVYAATAYLWDMLEEYHPDAVNTMHREALDMLHHRILSLAGMDYMDFERNSVLVFDTLEGEVFYGDEVEGHHFHRSEILDELLRVLS